MKENYGQARSITPICMAAQAAKARVMQFCGRFKDGSTVASKAKLLERLRSQCNFPSRLAKWKRWYEGSHCKILSETVENLRREGITSDSTLKLIAGGKPREQWDSSVRKRQRKLFQRTTQSQIKLARNKGGDSRIREKLKRWCDVPWGIKGNIGTVSRRVAYRMQNLGGLLSPRVASAVFSTLWNRWCTERRMQRRQAANSMCRLGCGRGEDSIEHYCRCPISRSFARMKLKAQVEAEDSNNVWTLNCVSGIGTTTRRLA